MINKLKESDLRNFLGYDIIDKYISCDDSDINLSNLLGQERAKDALLFGLRIKTKGYNIILSGSEGTGKTLFAKTYAEEIAKTEPIPDDLCYIYNFDEPKIPKLLYLKAGEGKNFKEDIDELINYIKTDLKKLINSSQLKEEKETAVEKLQVIKNGLITEITEEAKKHGFGVKSSATGIYFMPIIENEIISEEQFENLEDSIKEEINKKSEIVQDKANIVMNEIRLLEEKADNEIESIEYKYMLLTIGHHINKLKGRYINNEEIIKYLSDIKEDMLENYDEFEEEDNDNEDTLQSIAPWLVKKNKSDFLSKYKVNLFVDNSELNCAPVIVCSCARSNSLFGEIEFDSEFGNFTTDFMKIKAGDIHKANGGYLIIKMRDIISNIYIWEELKKLILTNKLSIEPLREYNTGLVVSSIRPMAVDFNLKILLTGSNFEFELLSEFDNEFDNLFKINAAFDYETNYNEKSLLELINYIKDYIKDRKTFSKSGIIKVIEYCFRLTENQKKITTKLSKIQDLLEESITWAHIENKDIVTDEIVKKALDKQQNRLDLYLEKNNELIDTNVIMIKTEGSEIGQINGLAVLDIGDFVFGNPIKITATTYVGKAGIINVEEEVEMSGAIHNKGVQVLTGYLGQTYAQDFPLSLSCRVCFEQNYSGIDGDSASSTELYCILSSISGLRLRQDIAVTGSINQRGEIQAIGGVTHKVEGFFNLCKRRGLTGKQGVIIPEQNVTDLVLCEDIIQAIKDEMFHIYSIVHIDEGLEILTGIPAGVMNAKGKYEAESVHGKVYKKLKEFYRKSLDDN